MAGEGEEMDVQSIAAQADQLYEENKWPETLKCLMKFSDTREPELLWQLARIHFRLSKQDSTSTAEQKRLADEGLKFAERGLEVDDKHFYCHKWAGILLSRASDLEGTKTKIEESYGVREYFLKAIELDPADAFVKHLMGRWCFEVANVPWYKRRLASVILATLPTSSFEEALMYFSAAEKAEPGFFSMNWLFLGKAHLQLGHKEEARKWLKQAAEQNPRNSDDREAKEEAETILRRL